MAVERDFIFGILAIQLGFTTPEQFAAAGDAWLLDPSLSVSERLQKALTEDECSMLWAMVEEAIRVHEGDAKKTLAHLKQQPEDTHQAQRPHIFHDFLQNWLKLAFYQ